MVPPPITLLPHDDAALAAAVRDVALLSSGLLDCHDSPLLVVGIGPKIWPHPFPVLLWDQRLGICDQRSQAANTALFCLPAARALRSAAASVGQRLREWGWIGIDHPGLCLVSDGTGVALTSATDRCDLGPGWLLGLGGHDGRGSVLAPFAREGVWFLLRDEPEQLK